MWFKKLVPGVHQGSTSWYPERQRGDPSQKPLQQLILFIFGILYVIVEPSIPSLALGVPVPSPDARVLISEAFNIAA
jgi:TctA family transporter